MVVVEGWVRLAPEDIARFTPAAVEMMRASRAEPGCIDYAFAVEVGQPGLLRIIEKWKDQAALDF
ncbi:putative quinol monooxygenase, partial [Acinetobacter baumannii]